MFDRDAPMSTISDNITFRSDLMLAASQHHVPLRATWMELASSFECTDCHGIQDAEKVQVFPSERELHEPNLDFERNGTLARRHFENLAHRIWWLTR